MVGAVVAPVVLALALAYAGFLGTGRTALRLWAAAFAARAGAHVVLMAPDALPDWLRLAVAEGAHLAGALLLLAGVIVFLRRPVPLSQVVLGTGAVVLWAIAAPILSDSLALADVPVFVVAAVPLARAAWLVARRGAVGEGRGLGTLALGLMALHALAAPVGHAVPGLLPAVFLGSQAVDMLAAVGLLVMVQQHETVAAERARQRAATANNRFLGAVESISDGFVLFDPDDHLVLCNQKYRELMAPLDDVIVRGTRFRDLARAAAERGVFVGANRDVEGWVAARLESHRAPGGAFEQQLADGRWLITREARTPDGGVVSIHTDITERKRVEEALEERERRLKAIMDTVADAIITMTPDGTIRSFNAAACSLFGYNKGEAEGRPVSILMPDSVGEEHAAYIAEYMRTGRSDAVGQAREVTGRRRDGAHFPGEIFITEMEWEGRTLFIGVVRDLTERKRAEEALVASEQRFRDLAEAASDWFWETDQDGHFTFVSARVQQVLGVRTAFFIGRTMADLAEISEDPAQWTHLLARLERGEAFRDFSFRLRLPDGTVRDLKMSGKPVYDRHGHFLGYRGTSADITAEMEARYAAERAQNRLMAALEATTEAFVLWDENDRLVVWNANIQAICPPEVMPLEEGVSYAGFLRALADSGRIPEAVDDPDGWIAARLAEHARPEGQRREMRLADGRWVMAGIYRTTDGHTVESYTDITGLKSREEKIARQSALLQEIIDNMPQGIALYDRDLRLVALNNATQAMFRLPASLTEPGTAYRDLVAHMAERGDTGEGDKATVIDQRLAEARAADPTPQERVLHDGTVLEIRRKAMPDGGLLNTYTDVTERKRTEDKLRHAKEEAERGNQAKAAFLASVSHELRTPLNAIIGFSETMTHELFGPLGNETYKAYLNDIHDSGKHLLNVINEILDMSKAEAGRIELQEEVLALKPLIESSVRLGSSRADAENIVMNMDVPEELPAVHADPVRLKQVLLNLLSNAVKFTEENGDVYVRAWGDLTSGIAIAVRDSGIGMSDEDIAKAKEPFAQVDSRLGRKYEGTGLGVPLSTALMEYHGGSLDLESAPGEGTTATIHLPPERARRPEDAEAAPRVEGDEAGV